MSDSTFKYTLLLSRIVLSYTQALETDKKHEYMQNKPYCEVLRSLIYMQVRT